MLRRINVTAVAGRIPIGNASARKSRSGFILKLRLARRERATLCSFTGRMFVSDYRASDDRSGRFARTAKMNITRPWRIPCRSTRILIRSPNLIITWLNHQMRWKRDNKDWAIIRSEFASRRNGVRRFVFNNRFLQTVMIREGTSGLKADVHAVNYLPFEYKLSSVLPPLLRFMLLYARCA